jgi:hypothetical protein
MYTNILKCIPMNQTLSKKRLHDKKNSREYPILKKILIDEISIKMC